MGLSLLFINPVSHGYVSSSRRGGQSLTWKTVLGFFAHSDTIHLLKPKFLNLPYEGQDTLPLKPFDLSFI